MEQLSLFEDAPPRVQAAAPEPAAGAQLDLFEDRTLLLSRARDALLDLNTKSARSALREALGRYPQDGWLAGEVARLETTAWRVEEGLCARAGARVEVFLAFADSLAPVRPGGGRRELDPRSFDGRLWAALLRWAAGEAIARGDDAAPVWGVVPGWMLLLAGDSTGARASLERALRTAPRASFVALLGECARREGRGVSARQLYLTALRANPYDVDFSAMGDEEVSALSHVARYRFEIEEEPVGWSAAVGVVTGVLAFPALFAGDTARGWAELRGGLSEAQREALERADAFLEAFGRARQRTGAGNAGVIEARRTMKKLSPALFEVVMGRAEA